MSSTMADDRTQAYSFHLRYPMCLIRMDQFLELPRLLDHQELSAKGLLTEWRPDLDAKIIVVSHQWLSHAEPDPENSHFITIQRLLTRILRGEVPKVENYWMHTLFFNRARMSLASWKTEMPNMYVWIDYCSMPQVGDGSSCEELRVAAEAVQSIPAYVERASLLLVLAPVCKHADTGEVCSYASWRSRGWCRTEFMCATLAPREIPVMVCTGPEVTPFTVHSFDAPRLPVGEGKFTCCALQHNVNGRKIPCDKSKVVRVLSTMLLSKVAQLRQEGRGSEALYFASLHPTFLKGLPVKSCKRKPGMGEMAECLGWTDQDQTQARRTGITLVMCAALSDNAQAVEELARSPQYSGDVDVGLKKDYSHLAYMCKGLRPLGAAMAFGSWETVKALLDARADPKLPAVYGMDAFFEACCIGNVSNVRRWLAHFSEWEVERTCPVLAMSAPCVALMSGCHKASVLHALLQARANTCAKKRWGGEAGLMCLAATNEDSQVDAVELLLRSGCSVNTPWRAHNSLWAGVVRAARCSTQFTSSRTAAELALLEGATPLHFAAKRGDIDMIGQLLRAGAKSQKNARGQTPLDVARAFFGGAVPGQITAMLQMSAHDPRTALPSLLAMPSSSRPKAKGEACHQPSLDLPSDSQGRAAREIVIVSL